MGVRPVSSNRRSLEKNLDFGSRIMYRNPVPTSYVGRYLSLQPFRREFYSPYRSASLRCVSKRLETQTLVLRVKE